MWRAFFIAIGIFLVILGGQCLIVDKFFISQNGKLGEIAVKAVNIIDPQKNDSPQAAQPQSGFNQVGQNGGGFTRPAPSPFGPSRFQSPYAPVSNNAGYGGTPFRNTGFRQNVPASQPQNKGKAPRPFQTQDWMPWSLIAAGMLVVIYTRATSHSHSDEH